MITTKNSLLKRLADSLGINAKFSRREKDIIDSSLFNIISPVEATLKYHGIIDKHGKIISKHGKTIELNKIIGKYADKFNEGSYLNLYLSPKDKHYFVIPYDGNIIHIQKNEGKTLIPIMTGLDNLFGNQTWFSKAAVKNATIGIVVDTGKFSYAMIAVGSLNVNNITVTSKVRNNYSKGAYAGHFSVGSTIILCFDKRFSKKSKLLIEKGNKTTIGKPIIKIQSLYKS